MSGNDKLYTVAEDNGCAKVVTHPFEVEDNEFIRIGDLLFRTSVIGSVYYESAQDAIESHIRRCYERLGDLGKTVDREEERLEMALSLGKKLGVLVGEK